MIRKTAVMSNGKNPLPVEISPRTSQKTRNVWKRLLCLGLTCIMLAAVSLVNPVLVMADEACDTIIPHDIYDLEFRED